MTRTAFHIHVGDQALAALAESDVPLATGSVEARTGYDRCYGQVVYQVLRQLERAGQVERLNPGCRPCFWRRTTPVPSLPGGLL